MPIADTTTTVPIFSREALERQVTTCKHGHARPIAPACHPQSGMTAAYSKGLLALFCNECAAPVFGVRVAGDPNQH